MFFDWFVLVCEIVVEKRLMRIVLGFEEDRNVLNIRCDISRYKYFVKMCLLKNIFKVYLGLWLVFVIDLILIIVVGRVKVRVKLV